MSIWGKVIGVVAGFAVGGPLGALLGVAAGHAVDRMRTADQAEPIDDRDTRQLAFTTAVIVLGAKLAKADGRVTRDEVDAFKEIFHIPREEMRAVGALFDEAKADARGFEPYAAQIAEIFRGQPAVLEEILGGLFHVARADAVYHPAEREFLARVAGIFGFADREFERIEATFMDLGRDGSDPYDVLGLGPTASDAEIKSTYRKLIRENHPDMLIAQGMPEEFIELANEKMATINGAYDRIAKDRGL